MMQFIEITANGPEKFREWEDDFRHIEAYIESLEPPAYPLAIDRELAAEGRKAFNRHVRRVPRDVWGRRGMVELSGADRADRGSGHRSRAARAR